jgi:hypothetical protein
MVTAYVILLLVMLGVTVTFQYRAYKKSKGHR